MTGPDCQLYHIIIMSGSWLLCWYRCWLSAVSYYYYVRFLVTMLIQMLTVSCIILLLCQVPGYYADTDADCQLYHIIIMLGSWLLCWYRCWLSAVSYLCWTWEWIGKVWFPLPQWNTVWSAVFCLQLVVQRRLCTGK